MAPPFISLARAAQSSRDRLPPPNRNPAMEEALAFCNRIRGQLPQNGRINLTGTAEGDEAAFEWKKGPRGFLALFDGSGYFGYAVFDGERYRAGDYSGRTNGPLPPDLLAAMEGVGMWPNSPTPPSAR